MALRLRRGTDTERQLITPLEGELIYTTDLREMWVGDGSTLGGLRVSGVIPSSISDLDDVFIPVTPSVGQILKWDGANFVPSDDTEVFEGSNYRINIVGDDSTVMVNTSTSELIGNLVGSVFADDSSIIIDAVNDVINTSIFKSKSNNKITFVPDTPGQLSLTIKSTEERSILKLTNETTGDLTGDEVSQYGVIMFGRDDINGDLVTSIVFGRENALYFGNSADGVMSTGDKYFVWKNNKLGVGVTSPTEVLDVAGNANISGTVTAGALQGTLVLDDSTTVVDGSNGSIIAHSYLQFGRFTTTERNNLAAANGMVIYNTSTNKFNAYENDIWINLSDGTVA